MLGPVKTFGLYQADLWSSQTRRHSQNGPSLSLLPLSGVLSSIAIRQAPLWHTAWRLLARKDHHARWDQGSSGQFYTDSTCPFRRMWALHHLGKSDTDFPWLLGKTLRGGTANGHWTGLVGRASVIRTSTLCYQIAPLPQRDRTPTPIHPKILRSEPTRPVCHWSLCRDRTGFKLRAIEIGCETVRSDFIGIEEGDFVGRD